MKAIFVIIVAASVVLFPFESSAKDNRVKFYNFDEMLIDGTVKKPSGLLLDALRAAEFKRLNDMRRSFLKELEATAQEKTLK